MKADRIVSTDTVQNKPKTSDEAAANASSASGDGSGLWWSEPFRMFQTNLREVDPADLDVERVLDYIQDFGAGAWLLSVGGIISNYPTQLAFQTRNPRLAERASGDLVGEAILAAHQRHVKLLARMDFSKIDRRIAEEHPEWCFVDPEGKQQVYNGLASVCPSGAYYQDKVFEILEEILANYEIDGFFFNWLTYGEVDYAKRYRGVCQCLPCHEAFAAYSGGKKLPTGPESENYLLWKAFTEKMLDDWTARVRAFISARRPEAPLIMGGTSDIVFHEANNAIDRPLWHHLCTEHVSLAKTGRRRVPVLVNAAAFVDMPYRLAGEEPHAYSQYLVQAIARGANPSIYIMGTPDTVQYECLEPARDLIRYHEHNHLVYRGLRTAARTALVRPNPLKRSGQAAAEATAEFQGLWLALLERHVPFDILAEERIAEARANAVLEDYKLLVLPDLGRLEPNTAEALDGFVDAGGRILCTGSTGFDGAHIQLRSLPIESRVAVKDTPELTWSSHLRPDADEHGRGDYPLPIVGSYHVVRPAESTSTGMHVISRAPYGPPEKCYGHFELDDQPGWINGGYGHGQATTLPWNPGRVYRTLGLSAVRDIVVDRALALLDHDVQIETDLPEQVEVILSASYAGTVIHLRNVSGCATAKFAQPLTIPRSRLAVRGVRTPGRVRALVAERELAFESGPDGALNIELPEIGLFEAIVIESTDRTSDEG